jgi:hypothetical protein
MRLQEMSRCVPNKWLRADFSILALGVALLAGCGSGSYPVRGQVVWSDGSPAKELAGGTVSFESQAADISARGDIAPDATFSLSSLKKDDGLPPGTYQVLVAPPDPDVSEDKNSPAVQGRRMIPAKYQSYESSGMEVTVEAKQNDVTLTVEKAKR